jgi:hypothetical protein
MEDSNEGRAENTPREMIEIYSRTIFIKVKNEADFLKRPNGVYAQLSTGEFVIHVSEQESEQLLKDPNVISWHWAYPSLISGRKAHQFYKNPLHSNENFNIAEFKTLCHGAGSLHPFYVKFCALKTQGKLPTWDEVKEISCCPYETMDCRAGFIFDRFRVFGGSMHFKESDISWCHCGGFLTRREAEAEFKRLGGFRLVVDISSSGYCRSTESPCVHTDVKLVFADGTTELAGDGICNGKHIVNLYHKYKLKIPEHFRSYDLGSMNNFCQLEKI